MDVLGVCGTEDARCVDFSQDGAVAHDLLKAFEGDRAKRLGRCHVPAQGNGRCATGPPEACHQRRTRRSGFVTCGDGGQLLIKQRQQIAAFGFAARIDDEAVCLLPAATK